MGGSPLHERQMATVREYVCKCSAGSAQAIAAKYHQCQREKSERQSHTSQSAALLCPACSLYCHQPPLYAQQQPMYASPDDVGPAGSMPQTTQEECQHQVPICAPMSRATAAKWYIYVVLHPR